MQPLLADRADLQLIAARANRPMITRLAADHAGMVAYREGDGELDQRFVGLIGRDESHRFGEGIVAFDPTIAVTAGISLDEGTVDAAVREVFNRSGEVIDLLRD